MAQEIQNVRILSKVDTISAWVENNPVLADKEIGYERETGKYKIGDGVKTWSELSYASSNTNVEDINSIIQDNINDGTFSIKSQTGATVAGFDGDVICKEGSAIIGDLRERTYSSETNKSGLTSKQGNIATASYSLAAGRHCSALGDASFALGSRCTAKGEVSCALGYKTEANGAQSFAFGNACVTSAANAIALGAGCTASGIQSLAVGAQCQASNSSSVAMGGRSIASGSTSFAFGFNAQSLHDHTYTMGEDLKTGRARQFVLGQHNVIDSENFIVVGNGGDTQNQRNILTVGPLGDVFTLGGISSTKDISTDGVVYAGRATKSDDNDLILVTKGYLHTKLSEQPSIDTSNFATKTEINELIDSIVEGAY